MSSGRRDRQSPVSSDIFFEPSRLESESAFISAATDNDTASVISVKSTHSKTPSMISEEMNDVPRYRKSISGPAGSSTHRRNKKKKKVRTRISSSPQPKVVRARTFQYSYDQNGHRRRHSNLTRHNVKTHDKDQAIRPPSNLHLFAQNSLNVVNPRTTTSLFRTPQPKLRRKSQRRMSRRNSGCSSTSSKSGGSSNGNNLSGFDSSRVSSDRDSKSKHISVAVRLRPLNEGERNLGMKAIWSVKNKDTLNQIRGAISSYHFEYVCPGIHDQMEGTTSNLYDAVSKRVVLSCCKGINGTIFAYGQTSSGKTYTMLGTDTDPGITLLALSDIFHFIRNDVKRKYALFISYIEIHNEVINDLLNGQNTNLRIVDTPDQGPVVTNCTEEAVKTPQDVVQCLLRGEKLRKVSETHSNLRSSRSHAIFRIFIQSQSREKGKGNKTLGSVLNLVDLAGSESSSNIDDHNVGQIKEAKHINQSLLCLGRVILTLSSQKQKGGRNKNTGYVPYRDSKLTRILQPSLGGNANTTVICTMSPCTNCLDESLNTLRFAQFTKKVKNHAVVNVTLDDKSQLRKYQKLVKSLKKQIKVFTAKSGKIHAVFDKMKKLKKQNTSLQHKIKHQQKSKEEMESRLLLLQDQMSSYDGGDNHSVCSQLQSSSHVIPTKPATPPTESTRFHRRRLFVSTNGGNGNGNASDTRSEPDFNTHRIISCRSEPANKGLYQINVTGDDRGSECGSLHSRSDVTSIGTPASIASTVEFQRVIINLQDKLEEVQGNIETLTNRIVNAQFVDINSVVAPSPLRTSVDHETTKEDTQSVTCYNGNTPRKRSNNLLPIILAQNMEDEKSKFNSQQGMEEDPVTPLPNETDTNIAVDIMTRTAQKGKKEKEENVSEELPCYSQSVVLQETDEDTVEVTVTETQDQEQEEMIEPVLEIQRDTESEIPVIRLDLIDDETPDLPQEHHPFDQSEISQPQCQRICDLHEKSMSQDVVIYKSLEDDLLPFGEGDGCSFTEKLDGFWKGELETEKQHSEQLLRMISGTDAIKLLCSSGESQNIRLWLKVQHLGDGTGAPVYMICWKRTFNATLNPPEKVMHDDYSESASEMNVNGTGDGSGRRNSTTISLAQLNSTLTQPSTLLLTSITSVMHGQTTRTFKKSKTTFSEDQTKSSCSLLTAKRSIDLIFPNQMQFEAWTQCLERLISDQQFRNSTLHSFANSMMHSVNHSNQTSKAGSRRTSLEPKHDSGKLYVFHDAINTRGSTQITPAESNMVSNEVSEALGTSMENSCRASQRAASASLDIGSMKLETIDSEQSSMRFMNKDTRSSKEVTPAIGQSMEPSTASFLSQMSMKESVGTAMHSMCGSVKADDLILPQEPERRISGLGQLPRFGHGTASISAATSLDTTIIDGVVDEYYSEMISAFMTPRKLSHDNYSRNLENGEFELENESGNVDDDSKYSHDLVVMQDLNNTILSILSTDDERQNDEDSINPPQLNVAKEE